MPSIQRCTGRLMREGYPPLVIHTPFSLKKKRTSAPAEILSCDVHPTSISKSASSERLLNRYIPLSLKIIKSDPTSASPVIRELSSGSTRIVRLPDVHEIAVPAVFGTEEIRRVPLRCPTTT